MTTRYPGMDQPQLVTKVVAGERVLGYVVIDTIVRGRAYGGLRMTPDVTESEIRTLARTMTLKYGFLGLPFGGAKAGVRAEPEDSAAQRQAQLTEFASAIQPLLRSRTYVPAPDMGTDAPDIRHMLESVGAGVKSRQLRVRGSAEYAASTVVSAARAAANWVGTPMSDMTAAIEGFGKVGSSLAQKLAEVGVRVVAISTAKGALFNARGLDVEHVMQAAEEKGSHVVEAYDQADRIDRRELLELQVDLLCPCARGGSLHGQNATRVQARIICPGANNPVTAEAQAIFHSRGVLYVPDFVANCGGVLGTVMEYASIRKEKIDSYLGRRILEKAAWIFEEADAKEVSPNVIAVSYARKRSQAMHHNERRRTGRARLMEAGLELHRRALLPGILVEAVALRYFERRLG